MRLMSTALALWHEARALERFDPGQLRDHDGQWTDGPVGPASAAVKDTLKLAGKIDLQPGERLAGSDKLTADFGTVRIAAIDTTTGRRLRLGIGGPTFGGRSDDAGLWRGGPDKTVELNAHRKNLRDEQSAIETELDRLKTDPHADPARVAALNARYDELDDLDTNDVHPAGFTADVATADLERPLAVLPDALARAEKANTDTNDFWDEHARVAAELDKLKRVTDEHGVPRKWTDVEDARWDVLSAQLAEMDANKPAHEYEVFGSGVIPGQWADVHYRIDLDDPSVGPQVLLGAVPHGDGDIDRLDDLFGAEQGATLDPAEAKKLIRLLGKYTAPTRESNALTLWRKAEATNA